MLKLYLWTILGKKILLKFKADICYSYYRKN